MGNEAGEGTAETETEPDNVYVDWRGSFAYSFGRRTAEDEIKTEFGFSMTEKARTRGRA